MKAALLISGYLRSFEHNISNIKNIIINKFDRVDLYIHITENELLDDKYLNINDREKIIKTLNKEFNVCCLLIEPNTLFSPNKIENNLYNNWFKYYKLNQIKCANEINEEIYDIVIKIRPDIQIINDINIQIDNLIHIPQNSLIDKSKLHNENDPYICDIISYGSSEKMNAYFNIYNELPNLISKYKYISETLLYHYLHNNNILYVLEDIEYNVILSQCNVFAITGDSGSGKSTLGSLLKQHFSNSFLLECDRYHKWERNDKNWKNYTHLNPNANHILKMNEDIFNLKIKNNVYQVDYDHSTGTFKEPELLDQSDNIIVCGLHSLYNTDDHIYDLTIYMDTDEKLKTKWKIERDTKKRGYTLEQILNQINNRKSDYQKYIKPQKEKADIIISFLLDIDQIKLKICIKKEHDINYILHMFDINKIHYQNTNNNKFNIIYFDNYIESSLCNFIKNNSDKYFGFYNYILYIIINLNKIKTKRL